MTKWSVITTGLVLISTVAWGQLLDPCCDSSPPWTICEAGSFTDAAVCAPAAPHCGSLAYYYADGDGNIDNGGIYQSVPMVEGTYTIGVHYDMGAGGLISRFHLRIAPAPISCVDICSAGTALYTSNTRNCGAWTYTGPLTYTPPAAGTYCIIATVCGNDGWTCGSLIAVDDWTFIPPSPVKDWVLY